MNDAYTWNKGAQHDSDWLHGHDPDEWAKQDAILNGMAADPSATDGVCAMILPPAVVPSEAPKYQPGSPVLYDGQMPLTVMDASPGPWGWQYQCLSAYGIECTAIETRLTPAQSNPPEATKETENNE